ncbi:MAG: hypothetical protein L4877_00295 [Aigarchaeota archaeon]|nr:hypothetical protein [Candidatus Geocrenenecus dongiae]
MPTCPRCGKNMRYLLNYNKVYEAYLYDGEEYIRDRFRDMMDDIGDVEYICPECLSVLFYDEEEADRFLKRGEQNI